MLGHFMKLVHTKLHLLLTSTHIHMLHLYHGKSSFLWQQVTNKIQLKHPTCGASKNQHPGG